MLKQFHFFIFFVFVLFSETTVTAQGFSMDAYAPFYHGVASGDPLTDKVILWTRVTPDDTLATITVNWRIALDTTFSQIVNSGSVATDASKDFTVKIDADGLQPGTWYYYDFATDSGRSLIGRTKTAPSGIVNQARFAVATCAKYSRGYFNAYARIGERNDIDAVIHVGDYIYESNSQGPDGRDMVPAKRCTSLSDFRIRYALYHTDPDLIYAHQQYPWIVVWDDHETNNDCWSGGSDDELDSASYAMLKQVSAQAYYEWLPIRMPDNNEPQRIYRKLQYGNLIDLMMLDTRRQGRMKQIDFTDSTYLDSTRTLLGVQQYNWLINNLSSSSAQWKIIAQQVMMAPLRFFSNNLNNDQWDGYPAERTKILNHIAINNIHNVVVLSGDFHASFSSDLPNNEAQYDTATGSGSVAVEFLTPAIASSENNISFPFSTIKQHNPHLQYADLQKKGYVLLDITTSKTQGDYYSISTVQERNSQQNLEVSLLTNNNQDHLTKLPVPTASAPPAILQTQAPLAEGYSPVVIGINTISTSPLFEFLKFYPNPSVGNFNIEFHSEKPCTINTEIFDLSGKLLVADEETFPSAGTFTLHADVRALSQGIYFLRVASSSGLVTMQKLVRSE